MTIRRQTSVYSSVLNAEGIERPCSSALAALFEQRVEWVDFLLRYISLPLVVHD